MAIAFVTAADSSNISTTPASVTIPAHNSGDLLVVVFASTQTGDSPATDVNTPSGWTLGPNIEAGAASAVRLTIFLKDGDGVESSVDITRVGTPSYAFGATCCVFSGAETAASAIDVSDTAVQDSGVDITSPSVNATEGDVEVLYAYVFDDDLSTEADVDSDAGFSGTLRGYEEVGSSGHNGLATATSTKAQASSGATGTCVWSSNGDSDAGCALTIVLKSSAATRRIFRITQQQRAIQ